MGFFNKKKFFLIVLGFIALSLCSYIIGYQVGFKSWGKQISISLDPVMSARGLASTEEGNTASVSREKYANPQNLFENAKVLENSPAEDVVFVVGNLLHTDEKGNTSFVCGDFSQVQFLFEAYGASMSGEKVIMKVNTDCVKHEDHQYIGPFAIPAKQILESSISKNKFNGDNSEVEFENVSLSWPRSWILIKTNFKKTGASDFSVISKKPETEDDLFIIEL